MKDKNNYYITTAIAYSSTKPHIGNVYEIVLTDAIARYKRAQGYNVFFQTGTDEHGQKIEDYAKKNHQTPKEYVDHISAVIRGLFDLMNVSYDKFIRTTDPYHEEQVSKVFTKLFEKGDLYKGTYEGWYSKSEESYFTDQQVKEGNIPENVDDLERQQETCYFFRLSKYQDRLIQHIKDHPQFIQPESRKNEMLNNFLKEALPDLAVTRSSFKWGIPVSFDEDHVIYVWIDALLNYITGLEYDADGNHGELFKEFWPADVHIIGKDILRFHTIYWPILLMALDIELPKQVFGHPWLLTGGNKMSKSKNNVVYVDDLASVLGVDATRYLMLHEMPFDRDGNLSYEMMIERVNTDLVNITGNLVNRSISMVNKYFDGRLVSNSEMRIEDKELIDMAKSLIGRTDAAMETLHVADAISEIIATFRRANKYIDETQPWSLAKDEAQRNRLSTILYNLIETIRIGAIALEAFIPETSAKILDQLKTQQRSYESAKSFGLYELNHELAENPEILFARLDKDETMKLFEKEAEPASKLPEISYEDFKKLDLQTGTIIDIKKHPDAKRLYVLQVDIGHHVIQIVSSLVDDFSSDELLGHGVVVVVNLKPAVFRGIESFGMLLAAEDDEGKLSLVLAQDTKNGSKVN